MALDCSAPVQWLTMQESLERRRDQEAQKLVIEQETLRKNTAAEAKHQKKESAEPENRKKELAGAMCDITTLVPTTPTRGG